MMTMRLPYVTKQTSSDSGGGGGALTQTRAGVCAGDVVRSNPTGASLTQGQPVGLVVVGGGGAPHNKVDSSHRLDEPNSISWYVVGASF